MVAKFERTLVLWFEIRDCESSTAKVGQRQRGNYNTLLTEEINKANSDDKLVYFRVKRIGRRCMEEATTNDEVTLESYR